MSHVIAIDPGWNKCGVVVANSDNSAVIEGKVIEAEFVFEFISKWNKKNNVELILLGNGTSSSRWQDMLSSISTIVLVDEYGTTLLARRRYWEIWPPSILIRWIPRSLILPPHELDAVAAMLLLEAYFEKKFYWPGPPDFKNEL